MNKNRKQKTDHEVYNKLSTYRKMIKGQTKFFVSIRFLQGNGTTIVPKNYANFASTMISCPFPPKNFTFLPFNNTV
jgi:hypothetical protein